MFAEIMENKFLGKLLLALSIGAFVLQSISVQIVQGSQEYYKPWFLLCLAHGCYIIFFPILLFYNSICNSSPLSKTIDEALNSLRITRSVMIVRIFGLTLVFTSASLAWYVAVSKIPLGDITAIYNTSCFFTYCLSTILLREKFIWTKFSAVLLSIAGIVMISYNAAISDRDKLQSDAVVGYLAAIISSVCAAFYEILYCKLIVPPTKPSVTFSLYVTGCIGACTLILGLFLFPIFHYTSIEPIELPSFQTLPFIALVSILGLLFNSLFLLAITFSGAVLAATGIIISIPLTYVIDHFLFGTEITLQVLIGSLLIFIGYFLLSSHSTHSQPSSPLDIDDPLLDYCVED